MQGYAPAGDGGAFAQSREYYAETEEWLASAEADGLQHAELEEQLEVRGRELVRRLFQGHLDLLAAREVRRDDGVAVTIDRHFCVGNAEQAAVVDCVFE